MRCHSNIRIVGLSKRSDVVDFVPCVVKVMDSGGDFQSLGEIEPLQMSAYIVKQIARVKKFQPCIEDKER